MGEIVNALEPPALRGGRTVRTGPRRGVREGVPGEHRSRRDRAAGGGPGRAPPDPASSDSWTGATARWSAPSTNGAITRVQPGSTAGVDAAAGRADAAPWGPPPCRGAGGRRAACCDVRGRDRRAAVRWRAWHLPGAGPWWRVVAHARRAWSRPCRRDASSPAASRIPVRPVRPGRPRGARGSPRGAHTVERPGPGAARASADRASGRWGRCEVGAGWMRGWMRSRSTRGPQHAARVVATCGRLLVGLAISIRRSTDVASSRGKSLLWGHPRRSSVRMLEADVLR